MKLRTVTALTLLIISGCLLALPASSPPVTAAEGDNPQTFTLPIKNEVSWSYSDTIQERITWTDDLWGDVLVGEENIYDNENILIGTENVYEPQIIGVDNFEAVGDSVYMWIPTNIDATFEDDIGLAENVEVSWIYLEDAALCAAIRSGSVATFNASYYYDGDDIDADNLASLLSELSAITIRLEQSVGKWVYHYEYECEDPPAFYEIEIEIEDGENTKVSTNGEAIADGTHCFVGMLQDDGQRRVASWASGEHSISWSVTSQTNWTDNTLTNDNSEIVGGQLTMENWYSNAWGYRKLLTIDCAYVENENFTNFPVPVVLTLDNAKTQDDGDDIRFTTSDGVTELYFDLESFDTVNMVAWVQIPTLYDNENVTFYIYYGNAAATTKAGEYHHVWDDNFLGVWHMDDNNTSSILDSTVNSYDGTKAGANQPIENNSKFYRGQLFDASNDAIKTVAPMLSGTTFTVEGWFTIPSAANYQTWFSGDINLGSYKWYVRTHTAGNDIIVGASDGGWSTENYNTDTNDNNWHYLTVTFESGANLWKIYYEGLYTGVSLTKDYTDDTLLEMGEVGDSNYFGGLLDEARLSNIERTDGWIYTTFLIENDSTSATTAGAEVAKWTEAIWTSVVYDTENATIQKVDNLIFTPSIGIFKEVDLSSHITNPYGIARTVPGFRWHFIDTTNENVFQWEADWDYTAHVSNLADTTNGVGLYYHPDGYFLLVDSAIPEIDNYDSWVYQNSHNLSGEFTLIVDVEYLPGDGKFYVLGQDGSSNYSIVRYDAAFSYDGENWSMPTSNLVGMHHDGNYWYTVDFGTDMVYEYDNSFVLQGEFKYLGTDDATPRDVFTLGDNFYFLGGTNKTVYIYEQDIENIDARIGVDTDNDGAIDNTSAWTRIPENGKLTGTMGISNGYRYQIEIRLITDNIDHEPTIGSFVLSTSGANTVPNKPADLYPTARQTSTTVALYATVTDNDGDQVNVFFYDNSADNAIDNVWANSGDNATVNWVGCVRGNTYAFYVGCQDNNSAWGDNSAAVAFTVNTLPPTPVLSTDLDNHLIDHTPLIGWDNGGADGDGDTVTTFIYMDNRDVAYPATTFENSRNDDNIENIGDNSVTLIDGENYSYRLRNWDGYEWSAAYSASDNFRMNSAPYTSELEIDNENAPRTITDFTPWFDWNYVDNEGDTKTSHQIQVGVALDDNSLWDISVGGNIDIEDEYAGTALSRNVLYYVRVRTRDSVEWSADPTWARDNFMIGSYTGGDGIDNPDNNSNHQVNIGIGFDVDQELIDNGYTFSWDFGDGSEAVTDPNTEHTYGATGVYTVILTVTTGGVSETYEITIIVSTGGVPGGGGGGGAPPAATEPTDRVSALLSEYIQPKDNVLFFTIVDLGFFQVSLWMLLAVVTVWAWMGKKNSRGENPRGGILKACLLMWPFLIFFGAKLMPV